MLVILSFEELIQGNKILKLQKVQNQFKRSSPQGLPEFFSEFDVSSELSSKKNCPVKFLKRSAKKRQFLSLTLSVDRII